MYFYIYKITNNITGQYYIGKHIARNPKNSYMGSGVYLKKAILKHGRENFTKEILEFCIDAQHLCEMEAKYVQHSQVIDPNCYNLVEGGGTVKGLKHSVESKAAISNALTGKPKTSTHRQHLSDALKGKTFSEERRAKLKGRPAPNRGKKASDKAVLANKLSHIGLIQNETHVANRVASRLKTTAKHNSIITNLGEFESMLLAAEAHNITVSRLYTLMKKKPDVFKRLEL